MKYTVYPAYLPDPTSSMVPNAPVRVLIVVPEGVALPAGTIVNAAANPTASTVSAGTPPKTNFDLIAFICALSSNRSAVDRYFGQTWTFEERYGLKSSTPRVFAHRFS
jgi:hypothetical protein